MSPLLVKHGNLYLFMRISFHSIFFKYTEHICQLCSYRVVFNSVNDSIIVDHMVLDYHPSLSDIFQRSIVVVFLQGAEYLARGDFVLISNYVQ